MTASEFLEQWQDFNESPNFVRYPLGVMASFGVTEADQLFLMEAGLPAFAAPHLWFFGRQASLFLRQSILTAERWHSSHPEWA